MSEDNLSIRYPTFKNGWWSFEVQIQDHRDAIRLLRAIKRIQATPYVPPVADGKGGT